MRSRAASTSCSGARTRTKPTVSSRRDRATPRDLVELARAHVAPPDRRTSRATSSALRIGTLIPAGVNTRLAAGLRGRSTGDGSAAACPAVRRCPARHADLVCQPFMRPPAARRLPSSAQATSARNGQAAVAARVALREKCDVDRPNGPRQRPLDRVRQAVPVLELGARDVPASSMGTRRARCVLPRALKNASCRPATIAVSPPPAGSAAQERHLPRPAALAIPVSGTRP